MNKIEFSEQPSKTKYAVVASFDMSGFSAFCVRPDAHGCLSKYISKLIRSFDAAFKDPVRDFFRDTEQLIQAPRPDFIKFTGDGAIAMWVKDKGEDFETEVCNSIISALRQFQNGLPALVADWETKWKVLNLPKKARIGIAMGPVYPLIEPYAVFEGDAIDYVGYPINLAVRLQDHCPEIGFLIHKALHPEIDADQIVELEAIKMKGCQPEPVIVFQQDFVNAYNVAPHKIDKGFK